MKLRRFGLDSASGHAVFIFPPEKNIQEAQSDGLGPDEMMGGMLDDHLEIVKAFFSSIQVFPFDFTANLSMPS